MSILCIYDDPREIRQLKFADGREWSTLSNCRRIVAYKEYGEQCWLPFFAIYNYAGEIIARVPATHVEVRYV